MDRLSSYLLAVAHISILNAKINMLIQTVEIIKSVYSQTQAD